MRTLLAALLACCLGLGAISAKTDGFTVLTSEAARRADIAHAARALPDAVLLDERGVSGGLLERLRDDGRIAVVNFIYTRCVSLCLAMGTEYQRLQSDIRRLGLADRVRLLSISFDPADTPDRLDRYARGMHADAGIWTFAMAPDAAQLRALLSAFGIVVIPAPYGQYEHNAAYHLASADGRLERIVDLEETELLLAYLQRSGRGPA
ncbi:SCO family protein [Alcaligenaceae bacterium]|nr:SCO family protein [Alcaligenaceae bacterium]